MSGAQAVKVILFPRIADISLRIRSRVLSPGAIVRDTIRNHLWRIAAGIIIGGAKHSRSELTAKFSEGISRLC
jgi:hypothetical protein